ncbi:hypothetical protein HID58_006372, partial [Brassica napus]
ALGPREQKDDGRNPSRTAASLLPQLSPENHPPVHRTTPEFIDSTPSSPRPPTHPRTPKLGEKSIHRPPTRAQPTNPSQLHKARDKHKNKKLNPRKELRGHRPATMELTEPPPMEASTSRDQNDAETKIYLTNLLAANPEEEESQRADLFPERNPPPDPRACRRNLTDRNNHTGN